MKEKGDKDRGGEETNLASFRKQTAGLVIENDQ